MLSLFRDALLERRPAWPAGPVGDSVRRCLNEAAKHGLTTLLHECGHDDETWPREVRDRLRDAARAHAMWEARHRHVVGDVLAACAAKGILPLVIKGTALAYSIYDRPVHRIRGDTDLLVAERERDTVLGVLAACGFRGAVSHVVTRTQATFVWTAPGEAAHEIDLHWSFSNSPALAGIFTYDELVTRAGALPALAPAARAAGLVDALLIACLHRARHRTTAYYVDGTAHYSEDRLIWLYDIHLLAGRLIPAQWSDLTFLARDKGLCAITRDALCSARDAFATNLPPAILDALDPIGRAEPPAVYLSSGRLRQRWLDLRAVPGLRNRVRYAKELVVPPAAMMRQMYPVAADGSLLRLHGRRLFDRLRKPRDPRSA